MLFLFMYAWHAKLEDRAEEKSFLERLRNSCIKCSVKKKFKKKIKLAIFVVIDAVIIAMITTTITTKITGLQLQL